MMCMLIEIMGKSSTLNAYYRSIPVMTNFAQVFDERNYSAPPDDWQIVVTDVVNSTKAIEAGKYKDVNVAGALPAMAITNHVGHMQFPFVFGGDGMVYLIPPEIVPASRDILVDTRTLVDSIFGLNLRIGIVPLRAIFDAGRHLMIARLRVSNRYVQAIIDGDGADYAEHLIKDPATTEEYQIPRGQRIKTRADFSGFTCRWKPIESPKGETISVIVRPQDGSGGLRTNIMRDIFFEIRNIFGEENSYRPVRNDNQEIGLATRFLRTEASVLSRRTHGLVYALRLFRIRMQSLTLKIFRFRLNSTQINNSISSDFRKFDGTLKMVISCTTEDRQRLAEYLDRQYHAKRVFYGIHVAKQALLTCLVQSGDNEVHFVDSDNGGYALAAKQLKAQVALVA